MPIVAALGLLTLVATMVAVHPRDHDPEVSAQVDTDDPGAPRLHRGPDPAQSSSPRAPKPASTDSPQRLDSAPPVQSEMGCAGRVPKPDRAAALAAVVPDHAATIVATVEPRAPALPVVAVIHSAHLNEDAAGMMADLVLPRYSARERFEIGTVAGQVLEVAYALVDAGVRVVAAEGIHGPLEADDLELMGALMPDLHAIVRAPAPDRRRVALERVSRGSNADVPIALYFMHGGDLVVEGVEPMAVVHRSVSLAQELTMLQQALASPRWQALREEVATGRAGAETLATYVRLRKEGIAILDRFRRESIAERDLILAEGAVELAGRHCADAVILPVGGFHAEGVRERLIELGAGLVLVKPHGYDEHAPASFETWASQLRAEMPAPPS